MAVHRSHVTIGTLSLTTLVAAIATTVTLAAPAPATVSMTPTTAVAGSPQTYVETFKASKALTNGVVTTTIPFGWTTPQTTSSGGPGFVSTARGSCTSIVGPLTVSPGAGPWTISAAGITCPTGATFTLTYASAFTTIASKYTFSPTTAMATAVGTPTAITAPSVTVSPGAASILVLSGTQTATAGTAISVTVRAQDAPGNTATGYRGTIHFSSSDVHATLPGDYTYKAGDNGSHTFSVTLNTAGLRAVTATDVATPSITGTLPGISVGAASASALQFTGPSSPTGAGVADLFTVTAVDSFGNTATGYLGTVHFTSTDPQASLPSSYPFSSTDAGAHQFSVTFRTLGSRTVTVTDNAKKPLTATTPGVTVTPGPATHFVVTGYPNPTVAGVSHSFTVTAQDQFNNTTTGYTGTVDITSTDGNAVLPAPYAFQATDAGAKTFPATLKTAGSQSISVADAGDSTINGSQSGIVVQPATASALSVTGYPATTVGDTHDFTVTALDAFNNTVTGYAGTVAFTSSDSRASLPSDYTFVGADAGTHTFSASLLSTPSQSITATQVGSPSVTGTQAGIPVAAGRSQAAVALSACCSASAGVFHPSVCRGRKLRRSAIASQSAWVRCRRSAPLGQYWRSSPLVFSLVPRCQGECGSAK